MRHAPRLRNLFLGGGSIVLGLLFIEFIDEFLFGALEAAWPLIRDDLSLTYVQIGLLLSVPRIWGSVAGVAIGVLGDVWNRRALIIGGGLLFVASLFIISGSLTFAALMAGLLIFNPSSGAFVGLSQSTLMDYDTSRYEQNMARWTFAGSLGVALGALALGGGSPTRTRLGANSFWRPRSWPPSPCSPPSNCPSPARHPQAPPTPPSPTCETAYPAL